ASSSSSSTPCACGARSRTLPHWRPSAWCALPRPALHDSEASSMAVLTVGVLREEGTDERRVALVPADITRLTRTGLAVLIESRAGEGAWCCDEAYAAAGAEVVGRPELCRRADVLLCIA